MKRLLFMFLFFGLIFLLPELTQAQCSMCQAVVESNMDQKEATQFGLGLNNAILYLMAIPYLALTFLAFIFFKKPIMKQAQRLLNF